MVLPAVRRFRPTPTFRKLQVLTREVTYLVSIVMLLAILLLLVLLFAASVARSWVIYRKSIRMFFLGNVWLLFVVSSLLGKGSYFPDACAGKKVQEKSNSVVISVVEGSATAREIEKEFNLFFGKTWRCTARSISPDKFTMRFRNAQEVEKACFFAKRLPILDGQAVVSLTPWSPNVDAKNTPSESLG